MPAIADVTDVWDDILTKYDEIVYIPMSSGLSSSCQTAIMMAEDYDGKVCVVNNQRISVTMRRSVLDAKMLADQGKSAEEIKDILEKEGLSVPTNMTELEECCDALMEAGYEPPLQQAPDLAMTFLYNNIAEVVAKEMTADEAAALIKGEEGSAEALAGVYEKLFGMMDKGYLSIDNMKEYEDNYNFAILKFYEGNTPFLVASTQTVSGMAKRESNSEAFQENPFEYEFIFAPTGEDGPIVFKGDDTGFALNKNCSYYDAAAEFYRFIYTEKILNQFSEIKGTPSTAANPDNELYTSLPDVSEDNLILFTDIDDPTDRTKDVFVDVAAAIVEGAVTTPEEATAKFEELAAAQEAESN